MLGKAQESLTNNHKAFQAKEFEYNQRITGLEEELRGSENKVSNLSVKIHKADLDLAQLNAKIAELEQVALAYNDAEGQVAVLKKKVLARSSMFLI